MFASIFVFADPGVCEKPPRSLDMSAVSAVLFPAPTTIAYVTLTTVLPQIFATVGSENIESSPYAQEAAYCLLPPYPEHGSYIVSNYPSATPGERYSSVKLDISCDIGYLNNNTIKGIFCINGDWSAPMPTCVRDVLGFCTLPTNNLKVEYRCLSFPGTLERSWECESVVPLGTIVRPICRFPAYFSFNILPEMHCRNGTWDYNPICKPACGLTTQHLQLEGTSTNHLELPWHASIYRKGSEYYMEYCGASLITATKIISAASCFYDDNDKLQPVSDFTVAVNKMYLSYNDTRDRNRQLSYVIDIKVPSRYRGYATKYDDNIAVVVVETPFFFHLSVRPVCLDFDKNLDSTQLTEGKSGKTVGWSTTYGPFYVLDVFDFSYVKNEDCENMLQNRYRQYFTKDKFCATYDLRGDSTDTGSSLAFLESTTQRYYLRGVLSDQGLARNGKTWIMIFTSIVKHEDFIKQYL